MLHILRQSYDKKSPLFIINIVVLIAASVALSTEPVSECPHHQHTKYFEIIMVVLCSSEVLIKTVGMEIMKRLCGSSISGIHNIAIFSFLLLNIGSFSWSVWINSQNYRSQICFNDQPHAFFLQVYTSAYALIYVGLAVILISLKLQNKTITVFEPEQVHDHDSY